jgi:hypothetical protein
MFALSSRFLWHHNTQQNEIKQNDILHNNKNRTEHNIAHHYNINHNDNQHNNKTRHSGAYLSEAPFRCSTRVGPLAFATSIAPRWKSLPGTNTLAYYKKFVNYAQKSFYEIDT